MTDKPNKPQAFVARYSYYRARPEIEVERTKTKWFLDDPRDVNERDPNVDDGRPKRGPFLIGMRGHYDASDYVPSGVDVLLAYGLTVREETTTEKDSTTDPAWREAIRAVERQMEDEGLEYLWQEQGGVNIDVSSATVRTPSALGVAEHKRRRAIIERFLVKHQIKDYSLECETLHSSNVCAPLRIGEDEPDAPAPDLPTDEVLAEPAQ